MNTRYIAFACVVSLGSLPVAGSQPPPQPDHSRLISFIALGGQNGTQQANMHSSLARYNITWLQFVQQTLVPQTEWGVRRFMLHLPFGKDPTEGPMSFDSYLVAQQRDLQVIWTGFVQAIRPLVEGFYTDGDPVEVICYLGSLRVDPSFIQLKEQAYAAEWISRFWQSIQPVLDAGCSLAFDTGGTFPEVGPEYWAVGMVEALGTQVYIEGTALPAEYAAHLGRFAWAANHEHYWRNIADLAHGGKHHEVSPWAQADQMSGEGILMISGHAAPPNPDGTPMTPTQAYETYLEWAPEMARRDWSEGFNVAMQLRAVIPAMTIEQLMGDT